MDFKLTNNEPFNIIKGNSTVDVYGTIVNLSDVATTGSYNDLNDKPTIPAAQVQSDWNASSGMGVILNKPTIPDAQVQSDWNASSGMGVILNKPSVDSTPTSGSSALVESGGVYTQLQSKRDKTTVTTISTTGNVSQTLTSGVYYRFGIIDSLSLTLTAPTTYEQGVEVLAEYFGRFSASNNWGGAGLSVPVSVSEAISNDTVEAGGTYEFNIVDNVIVVKEI